DFLQLGDGRARFYVMGNRLDQCARYQQPASAGNRGRADQSGGVEVVLRGDREEPMPDCGHMVANRNRGDLDFAAARSYAHKTRIGDTASPWHHRQSGEFTW